MCSSDLGGDEARLSGGDGDTVCVHVDGFAGEIGVGYFLFVGRSAHSFRRTEIGRLKT